MIKSNPSVQGVSTKAVVMTDTRRMAKPSRIRCAA